MKERAGRDQEELKQLLSKPNDLDHINIVNSSPTIHVAAIWKRTAISSVLSNNWKHD